MKKHIIKNKSAVSMVIVAAVIVIIVIAAVAGAYYYTTTQNPSTSPSPSATSTPSTSPSGSTSPSSSASPSTSPSPTPSASAAPFTPIANFHAGAYANYTITTYDSVNGSETSSMPFNWAVSDGNTVWVLTMSTTVTSDNTTTDSLLIYNIDKTTHQPISARLEAVSGGVVIMNETIDLSSPTYNTTGSAEINPDTIIGQESVTVTAGTFNCEKAQTTGATTGTVSNVWINADIPIWGIVKMTTTQGTVVTSLTELVAYG